MKSFGVGSAFSSRSEAKVARLRAWRTTSPIGAIWRFDMVLEVVYTAAPSKKHVAGRMMEDIMDTEKTEQDEEKKPIIDQMTDLAAEAAGKLAETAVEAVAEHSRKVIGVERDLLDRGDRQPWEHRPKESRASRPA